MPSEAQPTPQVGGRVHAALITATASGQGKSVITAALARLHRNAGRRVRVFKHGPDYLDPMLQARASGELVYQLHPWMTGEAECRRRLASAAAEADVILVEGSMGLFDGDDASSADLAALTGLPAIPVIDAAGMAQTFGAVALGLSRFRDDVRIGQIIANRVASARHREMLAAGLPDGIELLGAIPRHDAFTIPSRHLGIVQADELGELDAQLDAAAAVLVDAGLDRLPAPVSLTAEPAAPTPKHLTGLRIGIAYDQAFAFVYPANVELLASMGAELRYFSPLVDEALPEVDALWLPGGYPELYAAQLTANRSMRAAIGAHHTAGRPIVAECGGLMYCLEHLIDGDGIAHDMLGLLPGNSRMAGRLMGLGMQSLAATGEALRGHAFHHSHLENGPEPVAHTTPRGGSRRGEPVFRTRGLIATYFHGYFPSAPDTTAALFLGRWAPP
ncbi:MAG: cobyrinate a,c-diamide synthase [Halofilum sp. (in: g-proteobacteria)]